LAATPRGIFTTGVSERPQQESESLLDQQEMQNEGTVENIFGKAAKWLAERGNNAMLLSMDKSLKMVSNPVNIFESSFEHVILKAHNTMLGLMFGAIVLVIMYYAYRVIANSMELPPSTFLVRIIIVSVVAAFAPRLIQDILNINNHRVVLFKSDALLGFIPDDLMLHI